MTIRTTAENMGVAVMECPCIPSQLHHTNQTSTYWNVGHIPIVVDRCDFSWHITLLSILSHPAIIPFSNKDPYQLL